MPDCPFCDPPRDRIFHEGELVFGLWDGFPVSEGHALLVTRRHVASWFDATVEERSAIMCATEVARTAIEDRHGASDYNIGVNIGVGAGQTVPHLHLHLIPRRAGDVADPRGGVRHVIPHLANYAAQTQGQTFEMRETAVLEPSTTALAAVVGGVEDPLLPHLVGHLDHATRADFVVSFIMNSGLDVLDQALRNFLVRGGELRILTGDYLDVTEPRALLRLVDLLEYARDAAGAIEPRVTLRVFESAGTSFHPKAYRFQLGHDGLRPGSTVAYVGSSNLSRTALSVGLEWNYRVVASHDRSGLEAVERRIDSLFRHPNTRALTAEWIASYDARRRVPPLPRAVGGIPAEPPTSPPPPTPIQLEALAALRSTRARGNRAGLVVMATGLGKTYLAAFDARDTGAQRVLFVAHREEILRQAQVVFRRVMPDASIGLHVGGSRAQDADVVMASIQTLAHKGQLEAFARDAFDHVIVDEFHHAAAATYRRLIAHFTPRFLLGLTATPERTDGGDLLGLCGENVVYRCDLLTAITEAPDRIVPFHYFGIADDVDYANIPWRSGRFEVESLSRAVATKARANSALAEWRKRAGRGSKTLAFCCSQVHADFMARHFEAAGVRARALHAGLTSAPRSETLEALRNGDIEIIFAVDILNEGIDIPDVTAVMMLRPTESPIIFLQQLGRGLRRAHGKDHLVVIDHVGNHRSFLMKPALLFALDSGDAAIESVLARFVDGRFVGDGLPDGCEVTYELTAIDLLRGLVRRTAATDNLAAWYQDFKARHGVRPLAIEAFHESRNPASTRRAHGGWLQFVKSCGDLTSEELQVLELEEAGAFLTMLEVTSMTKSYKMVVLQVMLGADALPGGLSLDRITQEFIVKAQRHASIREEVTEDLSDFVRMRRYVLRNPVQAWCGPQRDGARGHEYFVLAGDEMHARFDVPVELRGAFAKLAMEVVDWRLARHLSESTKPRTAELRIKCKLMRNDRHAILKLPDRRRYEGVPEGDLAVVIDSRRYTARIAKQYVNVITEESSDTNVIGEILTGWFGRNAGESQAHQFVAFELEGATWTLRPLDAREATGLGVDRARLRSTRLKVRSDDGSPLDATFSVEERDGELAIVMEARGGTRGTPQAVNTDYAAGLEIILGRLQGQRASITRALLDTRATAELPIDERVLRLRGKREYPIPLELEDDIGALRRALTAAKRGNPTRRIRLEVTVPEAPSGAELARTLAGPGAIENESRPEQPQA